MTPRAFAQALRAFCAREPFRPFFIELVTGQRILIVHPEAVMLRGDVWVHQTTKGQYHLFDHGSVCRLMYPGRD